MKLDYLFYRIGKNFLEKIDYLAGITGLFFYSFVQFFLRDKKGKALTFDILKKQIFFTGYNALLIISVISLLLGLVVVLETVVALSQLGIESMIGKILNIIMLRELGPILTAIIILGRSGTAIATEIGNMTVSHEIEAIESMGIDPLRFIVYPRILGGIIAMLCLSIYFSAVGILSGFITAGFFLKIPFSRFFGYIFSNILVTDILISLLKSISFGAIISTVSIYHGFKINVSSTEVPQAVTKSVVNSLIFIFIFNGFITALFYL